MDFLAVADLSRTACPAQHMRGELIVGEFKSLMETGNPAEKLFNAANIKQVLANGRLFSAMTGIVPSQGVAVYVTRNFEVYVIAFALQVTQNENELVNLKEFMDEASGVTLLEARGKNLGVLYVDRHRIVAFPSGPRAAAEKYAGNASSWCRTLYDNLIPTLEIWGHFKEEQTDPHDEDEEFELANDVNTPPIVFGQRTFNFFFASDDEAWRLIPVWRTQDPPPEEPLAEEDDEEVALYEEVAVNLDPLADEEEEDQQQQQQQQQQQYPVQQAYVGAGPPHFRYTIRAIPDLEDVAEEVDEAGRAELHQLVTNCSADICAHLRQHLHGMAANERAQRRLRPHEMAQTIFFALRRFDLQAAPAGWEDRVDTNAEGFISRFGRLRLMDQTGATVAVDRMIPETFNRPRMYPNTPMGAQVEGAPDNITDVQLGHLKQVIARTLNRLINERIQRDFAFRDYDRPRNLDDPFLGVDQVTRRAVAENFIHRSQRAFWHEAATEAAVAAVAEEANRLRSQIVRSLFGGDEQVFQGAVPQNFR